MRSRNIELYNKELDKFHTLIKGIEISEIKKFNNIEDQVIKEWDNYREYESDFYKRLYLLHVEKNKCIYEYLLKIE